jgi:hypothetical protein
MSRLFATLGLCVTAIALPLAAQGPTIAASQVAATPCASPSCALEIRRGMFFLVIARGDEPHPARVGLTGASVVRAVAGAADAEQDARRGHTQMVRSKVVLMSSIAVLSAGIFALYDNADNSGVLFSLATLPIGLGGGFYSIREEKKALQSFDRAVWLYNRNLRPTVPSR